jgi:hypothetical protein
MLNEEFIEAIELSKVHDKDRNKDVMKESNIIFSSTIIIKSLHQNDAKTVEVVNIFNVKEIKTEDDIKKLTDSFSAIMK